MCQIVMPHENKDIKKNKYITSSTIILYIPNPSTTAFHHRVNRFDISIIFMDFAKRKSICFAHKRVFCLHSFHFNEKFLLLYYGLLWANVVLRIILYRFYRLSNQLLEPF